MFEFGHTLGCILSITCKNKAPKSPQLQACKKVNKNFELKTRQRERKKRKSTPHATGGYASVVAADGIDPTPTQPAKAVSHY